MLSKISTRNHFLSEFQLYFAATNAIVSLAWGAFFAKSDFFYKKLKNFCKVLKQNENIAFANAIENFDKI